MRVSKVNELFKCRTLTAGQWSLTPWRRALELCGGEKVKAGTDGEDGKGQMLGRKRQIRRKRDREKGRQTEKETERDGLKMATKSRAICGYKDGSGFKSFPHSRYSCFSFVFVDKGLKIRVYGEIERRWWGAISCFQTCMICVNQIPTFYHRSEFIPSRIWVLYQETNYHTNKSICLFDQLI